MTDIESADVAKIDRAICMTHGDTDLAALVNVAVASATSAASPEMLRQLIWMAVVLAYLQGAWDGRHGEDIAAPGVVPLGRIVASIRKVRALVLRRIRNFGYGRSVRRPCFDTFAEQFPAARFDAAQRA